MAKKKINGGKGNPKKAKKPAVVVTFPKKLKKALRDNEPETEVERPAKITRPADKPKEAEVSPTSQRTRKSSDRGYVSKANYVVAKEATRVGKTAKKFHLIKREYLGYLLMRLFLRSKKMQRLLRRKTVEE